MTLLIPTVVGTLGGVTTGMIVGDAMSAIPVRDTNAAPRTSGAATPRRTGDGTVAKSTLSARQSLYVSAAYIAAALGVLVLGSRYFRDARIG